MTTTRYRSSATSPGSPCFLARAWVSVWCSGALAEPMNHLQGNPFITEGMTPEAAQIAMRLTFFHWGLPPLGHLCDRRPVAGLLQLSPQVAAGDPFCALSHPRRADLRLLGPCGRCAGSVWHRVRGGDFPRAGRLPDEYRPQPDVRHGSVAVQPALADWWHQPDRHPVGGLRGRARGEDPLRAQYLAERVRTRSLSGAGADHLYPQRLCTEHR